MDTASESRLRDLAEMGGEQAAEVFASLANETRLAVLLVLWDAMDSDDPGPETPEVDDSVMSFSELYDSVEYSPSANFQYHLKQLTGHLVHKTEAGYSLTTSAERLLSAVLAAGVTGSQSFEDERLDAACMRCGSSTVVDYRDNILTQRCPNCAGVVDEPDEPPGVIAKEYRPPVGLRNRTPQEFVRQGKTWHRLRRHAFIEGTCPDCSGTVTADLHVCENHGEGVCDDCGRVHEVEAIFHCDVCKSSLKTGVWSTVLTDVAVIAFFYEHGLDTTALEDDLAYGVLFDAVETVRVRSEDPLEIVVRLELDGDGLVVTLDDEARVTDVAEQP